MSAALQPLPPADRVRVINRSVRCFIFGLVGVIPCFGMGLVWLAFKLFRGIAAETGERTSLVPLHVISAAGLPLFAVCFLNDLMDTALAGAIVLMGLQLLFVCRRYAGTEPSQWNPARHLMYWGLALANTGLILTAITVVFVIYRVNNS